MLAAVPLALTVEAHYAAGGLGSLVAEAAAEAGIGCRVVRCAVHAAPDGVCGSQAHLYATHGVSQDAIAERAIQALRAHTVPSLRPRRGARSVPQSTRRL